MIDALFRALPRAVRGKALDHAGRWLKGVRRHPSAIGDFQLDLAQKYQRRMFFDAYEYAAVSYLGRVVPRGGVALDVGANVGYMSSVLLSAVGAEGAVYAFEPVEPYLGRLRRYADSVPTKNLHVFGVALGEAQKTTTIQTSSANSGASSIIAEMLAPPARGPAQAVSVVPGDDVVSSLGLQRLDFVKIDVEGYEPFVLQGLARALARFRPRILCEVTPAASKWHGVPAERLVRDLHDAGYVARVLERRPWAPFYHKRDLQASDLARPVLDILFEPLVPAPQSTEP